jgi:hypothetical protein
MVGEHQELGVDERHHDADVVAPHELQQRRG